MSVLQHEVALALGLTEQLSTQRMEASRGFAGELSFAVVRSELRFEGGDEVYRPQLRVAVAPSRSGALPSVLGMDFKASFRLTVSPRDDLLILERRF